jgi:glycosyltransferase involved in cell wall biosynthesis
MSKALKKIALIHPVFNLGGAAAVAVWIIEALKADYDITLITTGPVSLSKINEFFGSNIREGEVKIKCIGRFLGIAPKGFLMKHHLAQRYYKHHCGEFDLAISSVSEMDFGCRGIQYIHIPIWNDEVVRQIGNLSNRGIHCKGLLRSIYKFGCMFLSGFSEQRMKQNITLVNSNWTGEKVKDTYGIESKTIYPPVMSDFPDVPWDEREEGFVCIGDIVPGKCIDKVIEIVKNIRRIKSRMHLHIIGNSPSHSYAQSINQLCAENGDWLRWEQGLSRKQLISSVVRHKYGIHGMPYEHFGIAVAEMAKAGCITFVPNSGGQVEIVADKRLVYENVEDAVAKIISVMNNSEIQEVLREQLLQQSQQFSIQTFIQSIKVIVHEALLTKS